jgi:hypothetical protein
MSSRQFIPVLSAILFVASASSMLAQNAYVESDLVCDSTYYTQKGYTPQANPNIFKDDHIIDAWGLAIRPAGAGGHFWIEGAMTGFSATYQGDVNGTPLQQDPLTSVPLDTPAFTDHGYAFVTGVVYNSASDLAGQPLEFPVSGPAEDFDTGTAIPGGTSGSAKFVFCTQDGCINAWRSNTATAMYTAPVIIDYSKATTGALPYSTNCVFTGGAMTQNSYTSAAYAHNGIGGTGNLVFAVDQRNSSTSLAGDPYNPYDPNYKPVIEVFDNQWHDVTSSFHFQTPASVGSLHPFNILDINQHLYVTYCEFNPTGDEGQEQTGGPGLGHLVEYNEDGSLALDFKDGANTPAGVLDEPWGVVIAPSTFGAFGGDVLVANFDSETIAAFNPTTGCFIDYLRDASGNIINIDGIWGLTFGNGLSLGDLNTLYFSAGPNTEHSGLFGKVTLYEAPSSDSPVMSQGALLMLALLLVASAAWYLRKQDPILPN